jgi:hypothetical protein
MLVSVLPASVATAARGEAACKVYNVHKSISRNTLQRAVWAADAGDMLLVQGTCSGTTLITKDLQVGYMGWAGAPLPINPPRDKQFVSSPRGKIRSGSWRPALVIGPKVDDFRIYPGLRVIGGIVIGDTGEWRGDAKPVPTAWKTAAATPSAGVAGTGLRACHVRNADTGVAFGRSQAAVRAVSAGDDLSLRGACVGETVIDTDLRVSGWRIAISGQTFGSKLAPRDDSGPPTLTRVTVDDGVGSLVLKRLRVANGFSIEDVEP